MAHAVRRSQAPRRSPGPSPTLNPLSPKLRPCDLLLDTTHRPSTPGREDLTHRQLPAGDRPLVQNGKGQLVTACEYNYVTRIVERLAHHFWRHLSDGYDRHHLLEFEAVPACRRWKKERGTSMPLIELDRALDWEAHKRRHGPLPQFLAGFPGHVRLVHDAAQTKVQLLDGAEAEVVALTHRHRCALMLACSCCRTARPHFEGEGAAA